MKSAKESSYFIYRCDRIDDKVTMNITNIDPISLYKVVSPFYFYTEPGNSVKESKPLQNPKAPMYMIKNGGSASTSSAG